MNKKAREELTVCTTEQGVIEMQDFDRVIEVEVMRIFQLDDLLPFVG